jgi:hypothetical protein
MSNSVGQIFVELDLDATRYTKGQQKLLQDATSTTLNIEQNFKNLGVKSSAEMDLMRAKITNSFEAIKNSSKASANDIMRAEEAKNAKLMSLNEQQFGKQTSFIDNLKSHWIAATAAIYAAVASIGKAWDLVKAGAEFDEQRGILDNLARKYSLTADEIVSSMKRASEGQIANADLMQVALAGVSKGLQPEQLIKLADAARILGDAAGKDATTALKDLSEALETGKARALKPYVGTAIDLKDAFGDLESKLTAAEKAQAMYSLTMKIAADMQAQQTKAVDESGDKMERLEATYKNATTAASRFFKTIVVGAYDIINSNARTQEIIAGIQGEGAGPIARGKINDTRPYETQIEALKAQLQARKDNEQSIKDTTAAAKKEADEWEKIVESAAAKERKLTEEAMDGETKAVEAYYEYRKKEEEELLKIEEAARAKENQLLKEVFDEQDKIIEADQKRVDEMRNKQFAGWVELSQRTAEAMEQNFSDFFFDMMQGKFKSLGDYATGIMNSIQRAVADYMGQLVKVGLFGTGKEGSSGLAQATGSWIGSMFSAKGNAFNSGNLIPYASGGIVTMPTVFPMASGAGLMGEAGPEAVMPLARTSGGELGVKSAGGGITVIVNNNTSSQVQAKEGRTANGQRSLLIQVEEAMSQSVMGQGKLHQAIRKTFNLSPAVGGR